MARPTSALGIDRGQVDRPAAARVGRGPGRCRAARVDAPGELGVVRRIEQALDRDVTERRVGQERIAVGHG